MKEKNQLREREIESRDGDKFGMENFLNSTIDPSIFEGEKFLEEKEILDKLGLTKFRDTIISDRKMNNEDSWTIYDTGLSPSTLVLKINRTGRGDEYHVIHKENTAQVLDIIMRHEQEDLIEKYKHLKEVKERLNL